ncbi:MAG: Gfo/Idh/MocA family oxidoreductase [Acidimicrobiales bacterium]
MTASGDDRPILVVGGGRWARAVLRAVDAVAAEDVVVAVASPRNACGMRSWAHDSGFGRRIEVVAEPAAVPTPRAALIANAARDHVRAASELAERAVPVLVEKPLALCADEARALAELGRVSGALVWPALVCAHDPVLVHAAALLPRPAAVTIVWRDPSHERRDGELKRYDPTISVVEDVGAHLWSILDLFGVAEGLVVETAVARHCGRRSELRLRTATGTAVDIVVERDGDRRERRVVASGRGRRIAIEGFGSPDPVLSVDSVVTSLPREVVGAERPLTAMVRAFLDCAADPRRHPVPGHNRIVAPVELVVALQRAHIAALAQAANAS